ncbi:MAG TPA: NAD-binding protein [Acidimicrobiales bacterium]
MASTPGQAQAIRRLSTRLLIRAAVAFGVLVLCPLLFWAFEHRRNADVGNILSGFTWLLRTLFEGGSAYDIETGPGYAVYYIVQISGVSLVAFLTGAVASRLVSTVMAKGKGMGSTKRSGHIVVCGWSSKGEEILRELRAPQLEDKRPVVVLAPLENDPTRYEDVEFIRGDPTEEVDLRRAGIDRAETAIILADESSPAASAGDRDARTLLTCLAVESINRSCYTCVEVIRSENRQHFARTEVNELIVSAELTGALLASSATVHGLTQLVTDLVTHPVGHEFYRVDPPAEAIGKPVGEVLGMLKRSHEAILIAVLSEGVHFDINPHSDRVIQGTDKLLVIASEPLDMAH